MISLEEYIKDNVLSNTEYDCVNEGVLRNILSLQLIKNIDPQDLLNGILNMYEYICDEDDIKLFFNDFPIKQRLFWKTLYEMYKKSVWSIFDSNSSENEISELGLQTNVLTKITVEMRRDIRKLIKDSKNNKLDIKPSQVDMVLPIFDTKNNKIYYITINRTTGIKSLFRIADVKFLEKALEKLGVEIKNNEVMFEV